MPEVKFVLDSMVTFLIAFCIQCFSTQDRISNVVSAPIWVLVLGLIVWQIVVAWEPDNGSRSLAAAAWTATQRYLPKSVRKAQKVSGVDPTKDVESTGVGHPIS